MSTERISLADVEFDAAGRAVISNPETIARLKAAAAAAGASAIKNIGCCSVEAQSGATEAFKRLSTDDAKEIKNIGCCSVQ